MNKTGCFTTFTDKQYCGVAKKQPRTSLSTRIAVKIIKHVANLVTASVSLKCENDAAELFRNGLCTWVKTTFRLECLRLLPNELYYGKHWSGLSHRISSGENPLEEAITNFYHDGCETQCSSTATLSTLTTTLDRCNTCYTSFTGLRTALVCPCEKKR